MRDVAQLCYDRMVVDSSWVYRRKETVNLISDHRVGHHVSVDFALPGELFRPEILPKGCGDAGADIAAEKTPNIEDTEERMYYVPLGMLRKAPREFTRFDLTDEAGRSLPLPTKDRNAAISAAVLNLAAERLLNISESDAEDLDDIAREEPLLAKALAEDLLEKLSDEAFVDGNSADDAESDEGSAIVDPNFAWLLSTLAENSIIVVPLRGKPGERRVIKMTYEEKLTFTPDEPGNEGGPVSTSSEADRYLTGSGPYVLNIACPFIAGRTFHFEYVLPDYETGITRGALWDHATLTELDSVPDRRNPQTHFYVGDAEDKRSAFASIEFVVTSPFAATAWGAMLGIAALVSLAALAGWVHPPSFSAMPESSPSLLLALPGLVAAYLARPEDRLVAELLRRAQRMLVGGVILSFVAATCAATLAATQGDGLISLISKLALTGSAAVTGILCLILYLPRTYAQGKTPIKQLVWMAQKLHRLRLWLRDRRPWP